MPMAPGRKFPTTARFGFPKSITVGHRIGQAVGFGSRIGGGLGLRMSLGAGRPTTMAAGSFGADRGLGGPVRYTPPIVRFGRRPTCPSSDLAEEWRSEEHTSELQSPVHLVCRL